MFLGHNTTNKNKKDSIFSDAEEELNKLAELADRINSQICNNNGDESFVSNNSQNVDLDQLFNFLSQVYYCNASK